MPNNTEKDLWIEMSIREISTQALFAEISYLHIDPKALNENNAVFSSIHSFLTHCAMVSKMLTSTYDDDVTSVSVGSILNISNKSFIHNRSFRNHLEHYDERLKEWIKKYGLNVNIGTYNIGSKSSLQIPNMVFVSHYNPETNNFTFVNDDFNLRTMYEEIVRIKKIADLWINNANTR